MRLSGITISGADDLVSVDALRDLSVRFPFVEWGLLVSELRAWSARYPSNSWVDQMRRASVAREMKLSLHLCGSISTNAQRDGVLPRIVRMLSPCRVQLNGFEIHARSETALIVLMDQCDGSEVILQANDETKAPFATLARQVMAFNTLDRNGRPPRVVSLLHDPSGGKGLVSGIASDVTGGGARVPSVPEGVSMGFAGGIREESVEKAARKAMAQDPDVESWLDLETGARDESDKFDLARVERILAKVAPFVRASVREGEARDA